MAPTEPTEPKEPDLAAEDSSLEPHEYGPVIRFIAGARYLFLAAVISTFVASVVLLLVGTWESLLMVGSALSIHHSAEEHSLRTQALEVVDTFLVATVLIVLSTGFYQLFITRDLPLPGWLRVNTPESMELKLLGVIVTVLSVSVLVRLTSWDGRQELISYGITTAAVITAISFYLWVHGRNTARH
ncbi:MAG: YqhA family protein [Caldilineaceae bacterium]